MPRSGRSPGALANSAKRFGCDIWYNCEVTKICTDAGAVSGVQLADGRKIKSPRVLCNIMPHLVYGKLLDAAEAPVMELKKANARTFGARAFCVFLGLDRDWRELGFTDYATFINSSIKNAENIRNGGSRDTNGDMSVNVLNAVVPDASPEGTCIVYLTAMFNGDVAAAAAAAAAVHL